MYSTALVRPFVSKLLVCEAQSDSIVLEESTLPHTDAIISTDFIDSILKMSIQYIDNIGFVPLMGLGASLTPQSLLAGEGINCFGDHHFPCFRHPHALVRLQPICHAGGGPCSAADRETEGSLELCREFGCMNSLPGNAIIDLRS